MDPFIDLLLGFLSIAFLLETMILIGFFVRGKKKTQESSPFLKRFLKLMNEGDNDGIRWKKMGEIYILIGAFAIFLEVIQYFLCINLSSINLHWAIQALLSLFSSISPGLAIAGIGMAIYAFGISLIDGKMSETNQEKTK